ncbi:MAG: hypothetical protein ACBR12_19260 [Microcoleus sp.]
MKVDRHTSVRSPPSAQAIKYTINIIRKINEDDRPQAIDRYARSGKLERSIAAYPRAIESKPKLKYI